MLDAHPIGCARTVDEMWSAAPPSPRPVDTGPVALVVGSSAGYGQAATVAGLARHRIRGVGVCLERPADHRRTATAGWYRTAQVARLARQGGLTMSFVNADAFADTTKEQVLDLLKERYGRLDVLIYSVAAPRRVDPRTGESFRSVVKPIGTSYRTKNLTFDDDGTPRVDEIEVEPASDEEVTATVAVMGGEDWARWVRALAERDLIDSGFRTAALSYIGSNLTAAIYRQGTIGAAKEDLEATARSLAGEIAGGGAMTSVNGATVTQSSLAIPGIGLYVGLLRGVMGDRMVSPVEQCVQLWDHLLGEASVTVDEQQRLRLDTWELAPEIQAEINSRWGAVNQDSLSGLADASWVLDEVRRLYGFSVPGVDYDQPVEVDEPWPAG
jgi:enoyl-[acyl-carrier protein] reductase / trans-2-enoyl-CoA reductase (NAD+)